MTFLIPEPHIELYKDGFESCKLNRKESGERLSDLVERINDPMVIALDAGWGAGKSVFLKMWVGAHMQREGNSTQTVYFDAFRHDYMDEPLIGVVQAIADALPEETQSDENTATSILKGAAFGLMTLGRAMAAIVTNGTSEIAGQVVQDAAQSVEDASKSYWNQQDRRQQAMSDFHKALRGLTENGKLVIVVDELDRCRPDYALNLLEVIKHFFDVKGVHFVLGVNLTELENSVKARYGADIDANRYLQKFYQVRMGLDAGRDDTSAQLSLRAYADTIVGALPQNDYLPLLPKFVKFLEPQGKITPRDINRIATRLQFMPKYKAQETDPLDKFAVENELALGTIVALASIDTLVPKLAQVYLRGFSNARQKTREHFEFPRGYEFGAFRGPKDWEKVGIAHTFGIDTIKSNGKKLHEAVPGLQEKLRAIAPPNSSATTSSRSSRHTPTRTSPPPATA